MGVATGVALDVSTDVATGAAIGLRQLTQDRRIKKP